MLEVFKSIYKHYFNFKRAPNWIMEGNSGNGYGFVSIDNKRYSTHQSEKRPSGYYYTAFPLFLFVKDEAEHNEKT